MKMPQNVLKMPTMSPDTSRETATPLIKGYNKLLSHGPAVFIQLTVSVSVLQHAVNIEGLA